MKKAERMKGKEKSISWNDVKKVLSNQIPDELLRLVGDLYNLSQENKNFIHARFSVTKDPLKPYKDIIKQSLYPDVCKNRPIKLSTGKKAISDYKKAIGNPIGTLELMVFYIECGNQFTVDYGDIDEQFYSSLESMFEKVLQILKTSNQDTIDMFLPRLRIIVNNAEDIGWGYYDSISAALTEAFPE